MAAMRDFRWPADQEKNSQQVKLFEAAAVALLPAIAGSLAILATSGLRSQV
jgi:hypothetical protein